MKVIIAGSRSAINYQELVDVMDDLFLLEGWIVTEVVSGTARGADRLGERWGKEKGIPVKRFPAEWDKWGKIAGRLRNEIMSQYADALVALWDGESRGTSHMIDVARERGLKIYVHRITLNNEKKKKTV